MRGPIAQDRSFWYMTFASYLDAPQAYAASQSVVESSLTVTTGRADVCRLDVLRRRRRPDGDRRVGAGGMGVGRPARVRGDDLGHARRHAAAQLLRPGRRVRERRPIRRRPELIGFRLGEIATVSSATESTPPATSTSRLVGLRAVGCRSRPGRAAVRHERRSRGRRRPQRGGARRPPPTLPQLAPVDRRSDQSRKFSNCSGMPMSSALSIAMTSWSASRFFAFTRIESPCV